MMRTIIRLSAFLLTAVVTLCLAACGPAGMKPAAEEKAELVNPWTVITEEEAKTIVPDGFHVPEGAGNVVWSRMASDEQTLVQLSFDLNGNGYTAREQRTGKAEDISGLYYDWTAEDDIILSGPGGERMTGKIFRFIGEDGYTDLCTWFDADRGVSASLSTSAPDLAGFDLQAVAEAMTGAEEHVPMDITGCDTFTQIVDRLPDGSGFANTVIGDTDVLLAAGSVYDCDGSGTLAAIDAEVYYYSKDGVPTYAGYVSAGGTAYPLSVSDGVLYVGGNHFMKKTVMRGNALTVAEEACVQYDADGKATCYYRSDRESAGAWDELTDDSVLNGFFDEFMRADMLVFFRPRPEQNNP